MAEGDFLSAADLLNFNKQVQGNSLSGMASQAIGSWAPDMTTWSPVEQGLGSFGKTFLSALLGNYARQDASNQLSKVVSVLPQLGASPNSVAVPEGVDADAFNVLKGKAALGDMMASVLGKQQREVAKGKIMGEMDARKELAAGGPMPIDPESPLEKKVTDLRTAFDKKEEVQNFTYVNRLSNQLDEIMKNPTAVADSSLAKIAVQFIEPKLSVNAGEGQALAQSASIPEEWKGMINKSLKGGSALPPEVRNGLLDLARAAKVAHGKAYQNTYNLYGAEADRFGIPMQRITNIEPLDLSKMENPIFKTNGEKITNPIATEGVSSIDAAKVDFARKAKASGMSIEDARKAWALEEKRLLGAVSAPSADILNMR